MLTLAVQGLAMAVVIVIAGYHLTRLGDRIADETGFGDGLVGFVLLGAVTSLPELSTTLSAAAIHQPDLIFGNIIGSNLFNVLIIGLMLVSIGDRIRPRERDIRQRFSGLLGIGMGLVLLVLLAFRTQAGSAVLIVLYFVLIWLNYRHERARHEASHVVAFRFRKLRRSYIAFVMLAVVVVVTGVYMTRVCDRMAVMPFSIMGSPMMLGRTFVGQLFLAVATSLPELIVSFSAVRMGKPDMAYANIFGSNIFNFAILGVAGLVYAGNLFGDASGHVVIPIFIFLVMAVTALAGIAWPRMRGRRVDGWGLISWYFLSLILLFNR